MQAAEKIAQFTNFSSRDRDGNRLSIESQVLCATGFRQEPEVASETSLAMPIARNGDGAKMLIPPLMVVSFFKFVDFTNYRDLRQLLKDLSKELKISGGIILAPEGINGSICGPRESVEKMLAYIEMDERLRGLRITESRVTLDEETIHQNGQDNPFRWNHVRIKLKKEIVALGNESVMPAKKVGKYVHPNDWNALISDSNTVLIDVRNKYEIRMGKFKGAVDPCTMSFREFPSWVNLKFSVNSANAHNSCTTDNQIGETPKLPSVIAMYCTGGIRCEKASSFLLDQGFQEVYHLQGGILKYLEVVPKSESLWEGECFVFDKRVSVDHGLVRGTFKICHGCKQPVSNVEMKSFEWEFGVTCPHCFAAKSEGEKERARARQRQFENGKL